ncbi:copine, putative [Entamoeba histolytica HM-1:IMSS-B]|uniref:Copine, putative n=4 Tax=Entamoeba histolytica TaxID=5759 RepID=C4M474_ENTH1|nr:copine, putative [Entamoeba histolytica HM-1:IMSS]EAL51366.1 copine, putative [Entamoeba histolytica HM-1:IMSS]EMH77291.1 copine, putative [Entamoeba histolytica HM-1:IMSS-B]ENY64404.1 copine, putative [Entamoeba histolytica HM-1:IMSS-A]GAT96154.1 copine putative [Entamoeba histolytica]|eukprot:XP_656751.1 copine, putative [Entamoeba histolytica HM-1:IMSS]
MGGSSSKQNSSRQPTKSNTSVKTADTRKMIPDNYQTMEELQQGLREAGLESSNLILGIDYTKSNTWTGQHSFGGQCLHTINPQDPIFNPYQKVIDIIGRTLDPFDDDHLIPVYGFGDITTTNKSIFSFLPNDAPCNGFGHVLQRYNEITPSVQMSGPTNFAPLINKAIDIVRKTQAYHILVIIADGQVDNEKATKAAIEQASNYPISIICIGVGDGPFDKMETFDDELGNSKFDNFNFVNFNKVIGPRVENPDIAFAVAALQEVPIQYMCCKKLGYF